MTALKLIPPDASPPHWLTRAEAAAWLRISTKTLWKLTKQGKIAHRRPTPGKVLYLPEDLQAYAAKTRRIGG